MRKTLDFETKKIYINLTLKWCKKFFGQNELKRTKLTIHISNRTKKDKNQIIYGNYCFYRNKITIFENSCKSAHDIVSTMIHEYTHYLQSRNLYKTYQDHYYYSTNPYEREAKRNEIKYTKICMREIKKLID